MQFKYRSFKSLGLKEIFSKNELFFCSPSRFNDPFDGSPYFDAGTAIERKKYFDRLVERNSILAGTQLPDDSFFEGELLSGLQQAIDERAVCSLSDTWESVLMWSHYADEHRGICVGFDFSLSKKEEFKYYQPVKYCENNQRPIISLELLAENSPESSQRLYENSINVKHRDWSYEQELRAIAFAPDGEKAEGVYKFEGECLKKVYLGAAITDENKLIINYWKERYMPHIEIIELTFDPKRFALLENKI